jgi:hypothetical protein
MGLLHWARYTGSSAADRTASYPCDGCRDETARSYFRAVTVHASPELTFRWICQLTQAPYSYDILDNRGHRSPRELTPGADDLKIGSEFLVFEVTAIEPGRSVTGVAPEKIAKIFGPISATFAVVSATGGSSRIVVKIWSGKRGRLGSVRRAALVLGDAIMMRKQLLTLRDLAERDQRRATGAAPGN